MSPTAAHRVEAGRGAVDGLPAELMLVVHVEGLAQCRLGFRCIASSEIGPPNDVVKLV